jgi:hypothetical protein
MMLVVTAAVGCQSVPIAQVQNFVSATNALSQAESDHFDELPGPIL